MNASLLLAHPYERSFNHALFERVTKTFGVLGVQVFAHDLYREDFDPVLTREELGKAPTTDPLVRRYAQELVESDLLVFIHPNWWGMPPALLVGWVDRVVRPPHAYDFAPGDAGGGLPIGKLAGKVGLVLNTANTPAEREDGYFRDPLASIWERCVFGFCGIEDSRRVIFRVVADSTAEQRERWLEEAEQAVVEAVRRAEVTLSGRSSSN